MNLGAKTIEKIYATVIVLCIFVLVTMIWPIKYEGEKVIQTIIVGLVLGLLVFLEYSQFKNRKEGGGLFCGKEKLNFENINLNNYSDFEDLPPPVRQFINELTYEPKFRVIRLSEEEMEERKNNSNLSFGVSKSTYKDLTAELIDELRILNNNAAEEAEAQSHFPGHWQTNTKEEDILNIKKSELKRQGFNPNQLNQFTGNSIIE